MSTILTNPRNRTYLRWVALISLSSLILAGGLMLYYNSNDSSGHHAKTSKHDHHKHQHAQPKSHFNHVFKAEFDLIDMHRKSVTEKDLAGKWWMVYFGFSYCPDICTPALGNLAEVTKQIGSTGKGLPVVPVFITVDPERDTPQRMQAFLAHFPKNIHGLTGTIEQIAMAAKHFHISYQKMAHDGVSHSKIQSNNYNVAHTLKVYLIDPSGKLAATFSPYEPVDVIKGEALAQIDAFTQAHHH